MSTRYTNADDSVFGTAHDGDFHEGPDRELYIRDSNFPGQSISVDGTYCTHDATKKSFSPTDNAYMSVDNIEDENELIVEDVIIDNEKEVKGNATTTKFSGSNFTTSAPMYVRYGNGEQLGVFCIKDCVIQHRKIKPGAAKHSKDTGNIYGHNYVYVGIPNTVAEFIFAFVTEHTDMDVNPECYKSLEGYHWFNINIKDEKKVVYTTIGSKSSRDMFESILTKVNSSLIGDCIMKFRLTRTCKKSEDLPNSFSLRGDLVRYSLYGLSDVVGPQINEKFEINTSTRQASQQLAALLGGGSHVMEQPDTSGNSGGWSSRIAKKKAANAAKVTLNDGSSSTNNNIDDKSSTDASSITVANK